MATTFQSFPRSPAGASREIVPAASAPSVLELIGNTPALEITKLTAGLLKPGVRIFAKLEGFNPGGSVKYFPARPFWNRPRATLGSRWRWWVRRWAIRSSW